MFVNISGIRCWGTHGRRSPVAFIHMPNEAQKQTDPRVYFAAERTFLAWIRTGLGLMGIGFAVARFGLFLREMSVSGKGAASQHSGISVPAGVALVGLGVVVLVLACVRYVRTTRQLRDGTWLAGTISTEAVVLSILLAVVGLVMGGYLLLIR